MFLTVSDHWNCESVLFPSKTDPWYMLLENSFKSGYMWYDRLREWVAGGFAVIIENSCKLSFHVIIMSVFCKRTALIS